jgi:hypothetical protein
MKNLNKTLLAAALMVAAGSANAAMAQGEAFLVAYDAGYVNSDGTTLGRTFNLDLGTTFAALQASGGASVAALTDLSTNTNWTSFIGAGSTSSITYGVFAAGNSAAQATNGVFISGTVAPTAPGLTAGVTTTPPGSLTTWTAQIGAIDSHVAEINTNVGGFNGSSLVKTLDQSASGQASTFAAVWGTGFGDPTVAYGLSDNFYYGATHLGSTIKRGVTTNGVALLDQTDINLVGKFTLIGNTLSYAPAAVSSVPLPAAVWMFGAGLMGVLRLNRRKSAQA